MTRSKFWMGVSLALLAALIAVWAQPAGIGWAGSPAQTIPTAPPLPTATRPAVDPPAATATVAATARLATVTSLPATAVPATATSIPTATMTGTPTGTAPAPAGAPAATSTATAPAVTAPATLTPTTQVQVVMPVVSAGETPQGVQTPWFTQPGLLFVLGGLILLLLGVFLFFRGRSKK